MPKPVRKKKRFITRKESTTYKLIPGYVEDDDLPTEETPEELAKRKEEEREHGVFYNDNYNYMKHMRSMNETATLVSTEEFRIDPEDDTRSITSSVLPKFFEMFSTDVDEGENIDPEILAALDDAPIVSVTAADMEGEEGEVVVAGEDGGSDTFLDDDFINAAGGLAPRPEPRVVEYEEWSEGEFSEEDEDVSDDFGVSDDDDDGSDSQSYMQTEGRGTLQDDIAEAQTALILRNFEEGLGFRCSTKDDDLEEPQEADYEQLKHMLQQDSKRHETVSWSEFLDDREERPKIDPAKYKYEDEDEIVWKEAPNTKPKFDCVSILSLNSNTRNLPTDLIPPSSKPRKPRVPPSEASEADRGLSLKEIERNMRETQLLERADRAPTLRPQGETAEEKQARKKAIKEERRERRQEKKANKLVFSMEGQRMDKETASLAKSVKSVRIS